MDRTDRLTPREREVLELIERGFTNAEISRELGISFPTAKAHVSSIIAKAGTETREEAVAWFRAPPENRTRLSRWAFAPLVWGIAASVAVIGGVALYTAYPPDSEERPASIIIPLESLDGTTPLAVPVDGLGESTFGSPLFVWVLIKPDGEPDAFLGWDPASGCAVDWDERYAVSETQFGPIPGTEPVEPWVGAFRDPCSGSVYDRMGVGRFGPTPRGLDGFLAEIRGDNVFVDLREVRRGWCRTDSTRCSGEGLLLFDDEVGEPSISGWGTHTRSCETPVTDGVNNPPGWCRPLTGSDHATPTPRATLSP